MPDQQDGSFPGPLDAYSRLIVRVSAPGNPPVLLDVTDGYLRYGSSGEPPEVSDSPEARCSGYVSSDSLGDILALRRRAHLVSHVHRDPGGVEHMLAEEFQFQSQLIRQFLATIGRSIFSGTELSSVTLPIGFSQPRSLLEQLVDMHVYSPHYLRAATETHNPVDRLSFVVTAMVAGLSLYISSWKPLNAILGETLTSTFPCGTRAYYEQVSHHPPVSCFELLGPADAPFYVHGWVQIALSTSPLLRNITLRPNVHITYSFPNSDTIHGSTPSIYMTGMMSPPRIASYTDSVELTYPAQKIKCNLDFGVPSRPLSARLLGSSGPKRRRDQFTGTVWQDMAAARAAGTVPGKKYLAHVSAYGKHKHKADPARKLSARPGILGTVNHPVMLSSSVATHKTPGFPAIVNAVSLGSPCSGAHGQGKGRADARAGSRAGAGATKSLGGSGGGGGSAPHDVGTDLPLCKCMPGEVLVPGDGTHARVELMWPRTLAEDAHQLAYLRAIAPLLSFLTPTMRLSPDYVRAAPPHLTSVTQSALEKIAATRRAGGVDCHPWMVLPYVESKCGERLSLLGTDLVCVATFNGMFLTQLLRNHEVLWDIAETPVVLHQFSGTGVLPSDSRYRADRACMQQRNMELGLKWKTLIEDAQRADRALRAGA